MQFGIFGSAQASTADLGPEIGQGFRDYLDMARAFRLEALVEVTDRREAEGALKAGAQVIGVNNRDLATFRVDPERTRKVAPVIAEAGVISVAESGIHDRRRLFAGRIRHFARKTAQETCEVTIAPRRSGWR